MEEPSVASPHYRCSTMLVLLGDQMEPDEVTRKLELQPWQSWRQGETRTFDSGGEHVYKWGGWKFQMRKEWGELYLEDQLERWYELLYPKRKILCEFANQDFTVRLDCLLLPKVESVITVVLDWDLQRKMVGVGLDLTLCIYPPENRDG